MKAKSKLQPVERTPLQLEQKCEYPGCAEQSTHGIPRETRYIVDGTMYKRHVIDVYCEEHWEARVDHPAYFTNDWPIESVGTRRDRRA